MEIYQVNELLAFVLLMRNANHFPFIQRMTFILARSYRRTIEAPNFGVVLFKKQIRLRARRVLGSTFKMDAQLKTRLKSPFSVDAQKEGVLGLVG